MASEGENKEFRGGSLFRNPLLRREVAQHRVTVPMMAAPAKGHINSSSAQANRPHGRQ